MSMAIFEHMRTTVINCIYGDSKSRLNLENACYPEEQNLLSSYLLLKNIKIKIYSTAIPRLTSYPADEFFG